MVLMFTLAPETEARAPPFRLVMTAFSEATTSAAVTRLLAPTMVIFCGALRLTAILNISPLIAQGPGRLLVTEARNFELMFLAVLVSTGTARLRGPYTKRLAVEKLASVTFV